jgi:hypothetical protein
MLKGMPYMEDRRKESIACCKAQLDHSICMYNADGSEFIQDSWHSACASNTYWRPRVSTTNTQRLAVGPAGGHRTRADLF